MRSQDYFDVFDKVLRANPRKKIQIPAAEASRRAALGESWAKLAREYGVTPAMCAKRVKEYRFANLTSDAVLDDIAAERDRGLDWLQLATRAGWPLDKRTASLDFATKFNMLMNAKVQAESKSRTRKGGRPKKTLPKSAYESFRSGKKTLKEIAAENNMSIPTARRRLLEDAGPDVDDITVVVDQTPEIDNAEDIVEDIVDNVEASRGEIIEYSALPAGYEHYRVIALFAKDQPLDRIARAYDLTVSEVEALVAFAQDPKAVLVVETMISDTNAQIEEALVESVPDAISQPLKPTAKPKKKRRGRKAKVYNFTDAEREFIRKSYYDEDKYIWYIADLMSKERGENVTQVAIKKVIADYSSGPGRRSKVDREALARDARRNLAVSTLAEMYDVSVPYVASILREMGIQPLYSKSKEMMLKKPSEEEMALSQARLQEIEIKLSTILSSPDLREQLRRDYLSTFNEMGNELAAVADIYDLSTFNMARVLTEILDGEIEQIRERRDLQTLVESVGSENIRKIQRDLIDRSTLNLRANPGGRKLVPVAQGAAVGYLVDRAHAYIEQYHAGYNVTVNRRQLTSALLVSGAYLAAYAYRKDEEHLWQAAGGALGVLASRLIHKI
ncbi:MAG: hypothetical protein ACXAEN_20670 [Candidatus Thorarchaeota archaeon]